ncbi:hypothetical protein PR048_016059 [Dryococelus australis]|uniref:Uncharacterized protein n=1 Tax=Dryococelus australis TaxID=614101 RepID=A0ABQ9HIN4_9NEOP|nr:hypothetical protein PR048_016059 [Dryococelus australis]
MFPPKYMGPFIIKRFLSPVTVLLQNLQNSHKKNKADAFQLKRFFVGFAGIGHPDGSSGTKMLASFSPESNSSSRGRGLEA